MKKLLNKIKKKEVVIAVLALVIIAQMLAIFILYSKKDNKDYEVNLVKINTEKDSIDYPKMKEDLGLIGNSIVAMNNFLASKNIPNEKLENINKDSLSNAVYLARVSNRYSQYLVDLQSKLQQVPLGMPTEGYISSNFGVRKNPIPPKVNLLSISKVSLKRPVEESNDSTQTTTSKNLSNKKEGNNSPAEADQMQFHKGLDIAVGMGSNVICTAAGKVIFAGQKSGYGNCVIVSHGNGLDTLYGHLSEVLVSANEQVKVGQVIAKSGNTGRSTGPHLHYEVHKNGTPVNPKLFLNF